MDWVIEIFLLNGTLGATLRWPSERKDQEQEVVAYYDLSGA